MTRMQLREAIDQSGKLDAGRSAMTAFFIGTAAKMQRI